MYVLGTGRDLLLDCMPKASVVAEIGVAEGDFSQEILNRVLPKKLHLVDPWLHQDAADYAEDPNNVEQASADARSEAVRHKFSGLIDGDFVEIHRAFSHEAVEQFPDGYFDWVYVDAMHTYQACLKDLKLYDPKVKADGFICGHDYANHADAVHMQFGVVEAVNEFVAKNGYEFMLLTYEPFPTYVIAKNRDGAAYQSLLSAVATRCGIVMEIDQPEKMSYQQVVMALPDGRQSLHYRFC